jgi:hypothetical protein
VCYNYNTITVKQCIGANMQKANNTKIKNVTTLDTADNSIQLEINLADAGYSVNGHAVESVTLYADTDCVGDLAVNWAYEETDNTGYVANTMLLMRNNTATDNVTETMQEFYWEHAFDAELQKILLDAGFSTEAVEDVCGSEWGMQDEGRASYDSFCIAEEMFAAHNLVLEDA